MNMKKLVALAAALLLMILAAAGAMAATNEAVNDARNGVVYMEQHLNLSITDGTRWRTQLYDGSSGTAFFIGNEDKPQYLVTCAHCVKLFEKYGKGEPVWANEEGSAYFQAAIYVYFDSETRVEAYLVDYDEVKDIAVLRIEEPTDKRKALKLKTPTDEMVSDTVYAIGYPGTANLKDTVTNAGMTDLTVTQGSIGRMITNSKTGVREVQTDTAFTHGNSGGPMVNEKGSVVGINANGYDDVDRSYNYAVSIAEIIDMCNRNNIPYALEDEDGLPVALIAVMAGVIVVLIVVIAVVSKKKGGKGGKAVKGGAGRVLVGEKGALAGKTFELKKGQKVTIGRNPDCQIRFPADTVGVSKVHCSVIFDGERVVVRDENSTAGTYIDENKVNPGTMVTLHRGHPLSIGSKAQILVLRSKK